jgi:hypothetical protein
MQLTAPYRRHLPGHTPPSALNDRYASASHHKVLSMLIALFTHPSRHMHLTQLWQQLPHSCHAAQEWSYVITCELSWPPTAVCSLG